MNVSFVGAVNAVGGRLTLDVNYSCRYYMKYMQM